ALDVFAFASHSETQGLVLVEAMATGTPVVAVDAPGVREVLKDGINGRMIKNDHVQDYVECLTWLSKLSSEKRKILSKNALQMAQNFAVNICVDKALEIYQQVIKDHHKKRNLDENPWKKAMRMIKTQTELMANTSSAGAAAIIDVPRTTMKKAVRRFKKRVGDLVLK
ncbi:MAG: glycosyltransferase, partial [Candidatus Omnitrophica bacterium]|nr:glycosyltransferase [Candidatus Omnitrophota bacterium]